MWKLLHEMRVAFADIRRRTVLAHIPWHGIHLQGNIGKMKIFERNPSTQATYLRQFQLRTNLWLLFVQFSQVLSM